MERIINTLPDYIAQRYKLQNTILASVPLNRTFSQFIWTPGVIVTMKLAIRN